ncbi:MAG: hypothetical protein LBT74_11875 [Acidobacteriota bacterium]|jgi:hypothetical protein|nr:hypothetical protein [Acidobacteriota bacterium]
MNDVASLNMRINQIASLPNAMPQTDAMPTATGGRFADQAIPAIRPGGPVECLVVARNEDGSYMVRVISGAADASPSQAFAVRATADLAVGGRFHAVWDPPATAAAATLATGEAHAGEVPALRPLQGEPSLLGRLHPADRILAAALLARDMPLSDGVLAALRTAWRMAGGAREQLAPLLELWARDIPLTPGNVQVVSWYMKLDAVRAGAIWSRVLEEFKARVRDGESPEEVLRSMKEGGRGDDVEKFLRGHSLLLRAPREDVEPALLAAPTLPFREDGKPATARVSVGRTAKKGGRGYWQMGFGVDGARLGFVGGNVESDGRSYSLHFYAERPATCALLRRERQAVRQELSGVPMTLCHIGVSQATPGGARQGAPSGRGMDVIA